MKTSNLLLALALAPAGVASVDSEVVVVVGDFASGSSSRLERADWADPAGVLERKGFAIVRGEGIVVAIPAGFGRLGELRRGATLIGRLGQGRLGESVSLASLDEPTRVTLAGVVTEATGQAVTDKSRGSVALVDRDEIVLSNGSRRITISFDRASAQEASGLVAQLSGSPPALAPPLGAAPPAPTPQPSRRPTFTVTVESERVLPVGERLNLATRALGIAEEWYAKEEAAARGEIQRLLAGRSSRSSSRFGGWPPPTDVASLPPEARDRLETHLSANWRQLGFESDSDALGFLAGARVGEARTRVSLAFSTGVVDGTPHMALYELGSTEPIP